VDERREKLKGIQRIIAQRMVKSKNTIPHVTTIREVRMERVVEKKELLNKEADKKVTFIPFIIKAVVEGIKKHPVINASLQEEEIVYYNNINIGIAVTVANKLLVPVFKGLEHKSFQEIIQTGNEIFTKARNNNLSPDDFREGTFTISNSGVFGGEIFTPIINCSQSAILGIGRVQLKPVVNDNGEIRACPMMYLCLSYDHRIINGSEAVKFLGEVDNFLQKPILDI